MEKLGKSLSKYLLMSMMALMLVCFGASTAFAAGSITGTEESGDEGSGEGVKTAEMLALAQNVKMKPEQTSATYTGSEIRPKVTYYYIQDSEEKNAEKVFEISEPVYADNKNVGTAKVTAEITGYYETDDAGQYITDGNGNRIVRKFSDTESVLLTAGFQITQADISTVADLKLSKTTFTYNGKEQKPTVTVTEKSTVPVGSDDYDVVMPDDCTNAGTKTVTVTGKGNFKGELPKSYTISKADFSKLEMSAKLKSAIYIADGSAKKPSVSEVSVKLGSTITKLTSGEYSLKSVNYVDNTKAGTATAEIIVTGRGTNFTGTSKKISVPFTISTATVAVSDVTYNGTAQKPAVKVTAGGKTLVSGTDYTVTYSNNKNAGTAAAVITFKGNYSGTATGSFKINPRKITSLSLSSSSFTYNGKAQKPDLTVKADKVKLSSSNYTVTITGSKGKKDSSIDAGTKTVTIKGKGNYTGTLTKNYTIKAKSISSASASLSTTKYAYNGKNRMPAVTVKIKLASKTVTLKKDRDYTVTYSKDCTSIGTKRLVIKGKGNYTGQTKSYAYTVVPEKASGLKVSSRGTSSLKLTCSKAKASGCEYQFLLKQYNASTKKWEQKAVKKASSNTATFTGLDSGRAYACYVRINKKIGSVSYTGAWSSVLKTATSPSKPVMSHAVRTGSKSLKAVWKAVSSATGYEVQYSTKSNFSSNVKTVNVKGRTTTSRTISGLNSSGTYYVRVRAYRTYNGKTYRGSWSSKVSTHYSNVYASYTTYYNSGNTNRSTNLRLACNAINGTILSDGETFSFNGIVGERTAAKGYKEAIIYEGGQEVGGIGGGICQVATTLFNAALRANFTIVERHQHSLTVHYCPLGYDAAIAWGSKNLRFRNNSGTSVMVDIHASGGTLSVKFLTNTYKKPPAVSTSVTVRNGVYTLRRSVNGKVNYTTTSDYMDN